MPGMNGFLTVVETGRWLALRLFLTAMLGVATVNATRVGDWLVAGIAFAFVLLGARASWRDIQTIREALRGTPPAG